MPTQMVCRYLSRGKPEPKVRWGIKPTPSNNDSGYLNFFKKKAVFRLPNYQVVFILNLGTNFSWRNCRILIFFYVKPGGSNGGQSDGFI
jgi:hypothetical protein